MSHTEDPLRRLEGHTAIITGSGSAGFGRAIALRVAKEGANVVVADLDEGGGKETVRLVEEIGGEAHVVVGDVSTEAGALRLVAEAAERFGRVDVLVNNAGIAPPEPVDSWNAPESSWDRVVQVNLKTVFLCSRAVIPQMIEQGGGSIVNIASIAATRACSGASYAAAKAGMLGYIHQVAPELASRNEHNVPRQIARRARPTLSSTRARQLLRRAKVGEEIEEIVSMFFYGEDVLQESSVESPRILLDSSRARSRRRVVALGSVVLQCCGAGSEPADAAPAADWV